MGSIVRVPLSGRRARGFVVEVAAEREGRLKDIAALSGEAPVFDRGLLQALGWAATHYVAPLSVLLERAAPPNVPVTGGSSPLTVPPTGSDTHPLRAIAESAALGQRRPALAIVGRWHSLDWLGSLGPVLRAGRSALVVAATEAEASTIAATASVRSLPVTEVAGEVGRDLTKAWGEAQQPGRLVVGTPRVAGWKIGELALAVVLEEGRRAMKDRQTPTVHVRDLLAVRSKVEGFSLVFFGPTPSVEVLAGGPEVVRLGRRAWALVEVVDRRDDPPGSGFLADRSLAALRAVTAEGRRSFVFTHRRSSESSMRCVACRWVRTCQTCGSRLGREDACRRCGRPTGACPRCGGSGFEEMGTQPERLTAELNRRLGGNTASLYPTDRLVSVGTERDLAVLEPVPLVIAVDVDGLMLGHNYRASEEALRILARLASCVEPGHGRRMMAQTSLPDSPLLTALRRGDPMPYQEEVLAERVGLGFPPATEMLAIEIRGEAALEPIRRDLGELEGTVVLGPASTPHGHRWLLQGELRLARTALRALVQRWREAGATVRIDADPIDL